MMSNQTMDLSPIYRNRVFRSQSAKESHDHLCTAISDHSLSWSSGKIDSSLYSAGTRRVKLMILRYGPAVEVRPRPFEGFALVQMPIRGRTIIESDGHRMSVGPGEAAVVSPKRDLRLSWSEDCEQLIVRVPHSLAREAVERIKPGRSRAAVSDKFAPAMLIKNSLSSQWRGVVQSLVDIVPENLSGEQSASACHPAWTDHVEMAMGLFLMTQAHGEAHQMASESSCALQGSDDVAGRYEAASSTSTSSALPPLYLAEKQIRSRLWAPLALEDLARMAGMSPRSFHTYCKKHLGIGPMAWLRNLRLDAARVRLQTDPRCNITEVALGVGFGHLGRFAAYYREKFGELPRATSAAE